MKTKLFIQAQWKSLWLKQQFMKSDQKCNCNVSNACLCLQRSVLIQPCDLRLITTENVDVKCAAFELVNMRSGKNCLRLDLLDCEDILLCCSGGTDLVFFGLSGCTWLTILAIFDWSPQKTLMLNVQPSNLSICAPAKIAWGWICWTVKTFCCVVVEVLTWFSSDWADVPGSRFMIAEISRCRFRDAEW